MSDRFHPVCGHHGDYVMGIGDNMYCGICKIERQAKRIEELEAELENVRDAAQQEARRYNADNERLRHEQRIQNECIADQHDTIRRLRAAGKAVVFAMTEKSKFWTILLTYIALLLFVGYVYFRTLA